MEIEQESKQVNPKMNEKRWLEIIEEWRRSGESQTKFCKQKEINYHNFVYWRKKHCKNKKPQKQSSFVRARVTLNPNSSSCDTIRIVCVNGVQIIIPITIQKPELMNLLQSIGITSC